MCLGQFATQLIEHAHHARVAPASACTRLSAMRTELPCTMAVVELTSRRPWPSAASMGALRRLSSKLPLASERSGDSFEFWTHHPIDWRFQQSTDQD